jgi:hypothetical protein
VCASSVTAIAPGAYVRLFRSATLAPSTQSVRRTIAAPRTTWETAKTATSRSVCLLILFCARIDCLLSAGARSGGLHSEGLLDLLVMGCPGLRRGGGFCVFFSVVGYCLRSGLRVLCTNNRRRNFPTARAWRVLLLTSFILRSFLICLISSREHDHGALLSLSQSQLFNARSCPRRSNRAREKPPWVVFSCLPRHLHVHLHARCRRSKHNHQTNRPPRLTPQLVAASPGP